LEATYVLDGRGDIDHRLRHGHPDCVLMKRTPKWVKGVIVGIHLYGAAASVAASALYFGRGLRAEGAEWSIFAALWLAALGIRFRKNFWI
jgi:hypothetical protein